MPLVDTINEDDDNHSLSLSTNSDNEDLDESYCHNHRSCSRYASCNRKKHQHVSPDPTTSLSLSNNSKPIKGEIRPVDNKPGHRQKYDGFKWRRICCIPDCSIYLNGGIFSDHGLCRKHLVTITCDAFSESDTSTIEETETRVSKKKRSRTLSARHSNKKTENPKRGDVRVNNNGIRQKYDGHSWRPVCNYNNCISFVVLHGYCHRHDRETRKKQSEIQPSSSDNTQRRTQIKRSTVQKPQIGDIQLIRQRWNGTKWYSLCRYYTQDCTRRSCGIKCAYLCDAHYKEYQAQQDNPNLIDNNDQILLSPTVKRKKSFHKDSILSSNGIDEENATTSEESRLTVNRGEQCIQTDLTYPFDSIDFQHGCFLIEDDNSTQYQSESPQLMACIKKEEEDYLVNKRKFCINANSLPISCKLEMTKFEM